MDLLAELPALPLYRGFGEEKRTTQVREVRDQLEASSKLSGRRREREREKSKRPSISWREEKQLGFYSLSLMYLTTKANDGFQIFLPAIATSGEASCKLNTHNLLGKAFSTSA